MEPELRDAAAGYRTDPNGAPYENSNGFSFQIPGGDVLDEALMLKLLLVSYDDYGKESAYWISEAIRVPPLRAESVASDMP